MVDNQNEIKKTYDIDTEIMKIIASFFVVMIHASGTSSASAVFFDSISRFSVPVFVIISGYYMLANPPASGQLAKKCIRLFSKMLVWSGIYFVYNLLFNERSYTGIRDLLAYLLTEPVHLWYCYAAITLYIFTPLLYVFCKNASQKEYLYALALTFVFGSLVIILLRSGCVSTLQVVIDKMKVPYTLGFMCLYLLGGYIRKYGINHRSHRNVIYLLGALGTVTTFIGTLLLPAFGLPNDLLLSFFAPNTMLPGAAIFIFIQQICRSRESKLRKIQPYIHRISACALGIYFLHPLILMITQRSSAWLCLSDLPYIRIPQMVLLAYAISALIVFALKRVPFLKRLV